MMGMEIIQNSVLLIFLVGIYISKLNSGFKLLKVGKIPSSPCLRVFLKPLFYHKRLQSAGLIPKVEWTNFKAYILIMPPQTLRIEAQLDT